MRGFKLLFSDSLARTFLRASYRHLRGNRQLTGIYCMGMHLAAWNVMDRHHSARFDCSVRNSIILLWNRIFGHSAIWVNSAACVPCISDCFWKFGRRSRLTSVVSWEWVLNDPGGKVESRALFLQQRIRSSRSWRTTFFVWQRITRLFLENKAPMIEQLEGLALLGNIKSQGDMHSKLSLNKTLISQIYWSGSWRLPLGAAIIPSKILLKTKFNFPSVLFCINSLLAKNCYFHTSTARVASGTVPVESAPKCAWKYPVPDNELWNAFIFTWGHKISHLVLTGRNKRDAPRET